MAPNPRRARIAATRALSPSVCSLSLDIDDDGAPFAFAAGQWLNVLVPIGDTLEKRAYSIASGPRERPIELAITHVAEGRVSPRLHDLAVGETLAIDGPHGFFTRAGALRRAPALLVGTGTGLCPLRSMLIDELAERDHAPLTLLFGVRTPADILWREELEAWAARDPRFQLVVTLSRPPEGWSGRVGYVQAHVAELAHQLGAPHVFICGLSRMVGEVRALCKTELGYDRRHIHSERYD